MYHPPPPPPAPSQTPRTSSNSHGNDRSTSSPLAETISDPARLLAVYPLGAPFTPSAQVAQHLSSLTVTTPHPSTILPDWHTRAEFQPQMDVLNRASGGNGGVGGLNEEERRWVEGQREGVERLLGQGQGSSSNSYRPAPTPYPYQLPQSYIASSLLQSRPLPPWAFEHSHPVYASSTAPQPVPSPAPSTSTFAPEDSPQFFEDFIAQTLASIPLESNQQHQNQTSRSSSSRSSMVPSSSPGNGGGSSNPASSYGQRTPSRQNSTASLGARMSAQQLQPPPPQPNFQPVASTSSLRNSASNSSLKRKELHLPDINDPAAADSSNSNKRLATPSSPFADPSSTSSSKPNQRKSETPTRRKGLQASSSQPNAIAGPSNCMDVYVELPALSLSQPAAAPSSSSLTELAGSTAPLQHPKSELDNFDSPVQSEYGSEEEEEEDGDDYMREGGREEDASGGARKGKGKGRARRSSLSGTPRGRVDSPRKAGGDTGGRDERDASTKLRELSENILESLDTLPHPIPPNHFTTPSSPHPYFSRLSSSSNSSNTRPLLNAGTLKKLTRLLGVVTKKVNSSSSSSLSNGEKKEWWGSSLEEGDPERLMALLRGSLEEAQEVGEVWGPSVGGTTPGAGKAAGAGGKKAGSKSPEKGKGKAAAAKVEDGDGDVEMKDEVKDEGEGAGVVGAGESPGLESVETMMEVALEAALATDCCLVLLSSKGVPTHLYSEEMILLCLGIVKQLLSTIVYPYVEALADLSSTSFPLLTHLITTASTKPSSARLKPLSELFQTLILVLPHLQDLISSPAVGMSDDIGIQIVYISIGPFFIADPQLSGKGRSEKAVKGKTAEAAMGMLGGKSGLRGLRMAALGLLRTIFGRHENQRSWIVQEVLMSLIKLPDIKKSQKQFQLRDGRAIHIVSALLLQLIQSCTHGVQTEVERRRTKAKSQMIIDKKDEDEDASQAAELEKQESIIYSSGLEASTKSAKSIAMFLVQSSASGKASKSSEADYRAVLDMVLSDLVVVVYSPEWPASVLLLGWFCKLMINSLNDEKSSAEDNASKAIALDHLGLIGARLRTASVQTTARVQKRVGGGAGGGAAAGSSASSLADIVSTSDLQGLKRLITMQDEVLSYLDKLALGDPSITGTTEYSACIWGQELTAELSKIDTSSTASPQKKKPSSLSSTAAEEENALVARRAVAAELRTGIEGLWKDRGSGDVFGGESTEADEIDAISEELNCTRALNRAFDPILNAVLCALDSSSVTFRTKALRALGHIVTSDATVLSHANVRRTIENRLNDSSPAVRDAAIELLGRYLTQQPALVDEYYARISERINDSGLAVRKRVVKLLKTIYLASSNISRKVDICVKLFQRSEDEDEGIKDLAVRTIEELWFSDSTEAAALDSSDRTAIVMGVAGCFRDRQNPLELFLRQIVEEKSKVKDGKVASSILQHYRELCDALIDKLIDAQDKPDLNVNHCIKAIYHLSVAYPEAVSSSKAAILLPYLRSPTNPEEQANTSFLLKIFAASVVKMPKTASNFARTLEQKLLAMVNKASGGAAGLQESIACLCAVVNNLTQNYERLVKILASCVSKLEQVRSGFKKTGKLPEDQKNISLLLCITGLLGEHCDFDEVSATNGAMAIEIKQITKDYVSDYIFDLLCAFREMPAIPAVRKAALQSMGFLFRAYPTLMMHDTSLKIMDDVLDGNDLETQAVLLGIIQDFLIAESVKSGTNDKKTDAEKELLKGKVNMVELIGDTDNYAESNVSTSIVQRYLLRILDAALHSETQNIAVEILTFTVKQGLAHPIQSAPIMIALETSADPTIVSRAFAIHSILHHKHGSIINTRFSETARVCFDYQSKTSAEAVRGFRPTIVNTSVVPVPVAHLHLWYSLIREKRPLRRDFLKILVRSFDVDAADSSTRTSISRNEVDFCRFLADNLATFDYKTQEEVLVVLDRLTAIVAVSGSHLFDILSSFEVPADRSDQPITGEVFEIRVGASMRTSMAEDERSEDEEMDEEATKPVDVNSPSKRNLPKPQVFKAETLANVSIVLSLVLALKEHLKLLYNLPEAKCRKFSLTAKKSALGDKAAVRQPSAKLELDLSGIPGALVSVRSMGELAAQVQAFLALVEGTTFAAEPEGDDD